jgi:hypothetical protein
MKFNKLQSLLEDKLNINTLVDKELLYLSSFKDKEHLVIYNIKGERFEFNGEVGKVGMPVERLEDTVIAVHNHIINCSFSLSDISNFLRISIIQRASIVCNNGVKFNIQPTSSTKFFKVDTDKNIIMNHLIQLHNRIKTKYILKYKELYVSNKMNEADIFYNLSHDVNRDLTSELNIKYWKEE